MKIKLNCDMGESFGIWQSGVDEEIMPLIDMANLACGFHASDPITMNNAVKLAALHKVKIGAHPGYPDLLGFGRRSINCSLEEIEALIIYQCGALNAICKLHGTKIRYIKPHGALYNDMMKDEFIFTAIVDAISKYDKRLKLMVLSSPKNTEYKKIAKKYGVKLIYEVFADRNYTNKGYLVQRTKKEAVIKDKDEVIKRVKELKNSGTIQSINGKKLKLKADTICVHGDNDQALKFVKELKKFI